jgi:acetyl esterase/lipase
VADCADITLMPQANSWYIGANVPGKPRVYLPYLGGVDAYRRACEEVVANDHLGFAFDGSAGGHARDGVVRRLQPDVQMVLELLGTLDLPPFESLPPEAARGLLAQINAERPPGPAMGEIVDGQLPGAAGPLDYRLYRPDTKGPHPVVLYFHGGGWVIGHQTSDEPLCRDLAHRANAIVVSVNYRHGPEARFPAAADDALAATRWVSEHTAELGGLPGPIVLAGWSAGANQVAVTAQRLRDQGGPAIAGQLMLTPVTDAADTSRPSYTENAEGYVLTAPLMHWFLDHYVDEADRADPRVSPLRAQSLAGLPPACIVTADFDPLRDEGNDFAEAMRKAGIPVQQIRARGHTHTSVTMVDVIVSGAPIREKMAAAIDGFFRQAGVVKG